MYEETENYIAYNLFQIYGEEWIKNFPRIIIHISKYINDRQEILSTRNYGTKLFYTTADENRFYDSAGIDVNVVKGLVNSSKTIVHVPDATNPLYVSLYCLAGFYDRNQKILEKFMPKEKFHAGNFIRFYLTLRIYSICQRQSFPYPPKDNLVEYTLDHLNNRFDFAKINNIYEWLDNMTLSNNQALELDFKNPKDVDVNAWVSKIVKRCKSALHNLYRETEKNRLNGAGNTIEDIQAENEDGKKWFTISTSTSNTIEVLCNKILTTFVQETNIRENLMKVACKKANNVSKVKTAMVLKQIRESKDHVLLSRIIRDILSYWIISLNKESSSIHSTEFIKKCSIAYSISNTNDPFIIDLKKTLAEIMSKYSSVYMETESKTSLNSFKQATFLYMVFYISSIK